MMSYGIVFLSVAAADHLLNRGALESMIIKPALTAIGAVLCLASLVVWSWRAMP